MTCTYASDAEMFDAVLADVRRALREKDHEIEVLKAKLVDLEVLARGRQNRIEELAAAVLKLQFNNDVLKDANADLQEYVGQLHGLKEVLRAEVSQLDGDWPAAERRYAAARTTVR